jgi:anaerobic selenocysteine-containing dehydrogenase
MLSMDLVVFWGFNAAVSSPHMWALAKKARRERGARIIAVDPVENETVKGADLWLQPMPGSDTALAYGVMNHLLQGNCVDKKFIEDWATGFEELKAEADKWTPDRVEQITGVPGRLVEQLGEAYGGSKPSVTMIGIGLQKCDRGADQVRAVSFIPTLLGLHRGFFYSNGHSFLIDESLVSGRTLTGNTPKVVEQVALPELIKNGRFKFIYISCMNPAVTLPNQNALRDGLSRKDVFVVLHETHWTKTAQYADVVLPAPTFLEKEDLIIPWGHHYVRRSNAAVSPVTDSRTEVQIMREIAGRLGLVEDWLYEDPWDAVERGFENALESGGFEALKSGELLELKTRPKDDYPTPSGKIEFHSSVAAKLGFDPLPAQAPLHIDEDRFILLTSATPRFTSTQFQEVYGAIPAVVAISSADAERIGVKKGDVVTLANERGRVQAEVTVSDTLPRNVAWAPRQFEDATGEPQNSLASSTPQKIGAGPRFNSTRVTITKS